VAVNHVSVTVVSPNETEAPTFRCELIGPQSGSSGSSICQETFGGLLDGKYTLKITATDKAGNSSAQEVIEWTVDTQAPAPPVVLLPAPGAPYKDVIVQGTAEPQSTVSIYIDDGASPVTAVTVGDGGNWRVLLTADQRLSEGPHSVRVIARDRAGNLSTKTGPDPVVHFSVDTEAPTVSIVEKPPVRTSSTSTKFRFALAKDEPVTFSCSLDGGDFVPCDAEVTFTDLRESLHTLYVRATDAAGNEGLPTGYTWTVYFGGDTYGLGGGLSCATAGSAGPMLWLLGGLAWFAAAARRRR